MSDGRLEGRTALVTGGSRGIGAAIARAFAAEGAAVALLHLGDHANAKNLVAEIEAAGRTALACEGDVADPDAVAQAIGRVETGLGPVEILVSCAGIVDETPFEAMTLAAWDRMIAVHLRGTFLMAHAVYPGMRARGFGRIINFASQVAYKGMKGLTHYCAAKAGIIGLTRALALEGAPHGVTVNAIAPGPTDTDILLGMSPEWRARKMAELPIGRFATPAEIAPTAVLLASDDGAFYVGQTLSPNGGDVML
ncbi:MAG: SDR family NAD(P)-dependent oxidoreductase [Geminicoccaceae bacterium]